MPRRALRRLLPFAVALITASAAYAVDEGEPAPHIDAKSLTGNTQVSLAGMRGKVVLVDFWASWCAPCNVAMPQLDALAKEFSADEFRVLGVNVDENPEDARHTLAKHPVSYENASDPTGKLPARFGLSTMPTTYLVDRNGVVRGVHPGFRKGDIDELRAQVKKLLAERK